MKIPDDAIISDDKLTRYLLVHKARNDKSKFLARAGFTQQNPGALLAAIRSLIGMVEAVEDRTDEYGTFYRVEGELIGVNSVNLSVATIWLRRKLDGKFQFITLIPRKE
ncbi:MAG: DUF6883 domain-containing protein [Blastocatellia bacterium]